MGYWTHLRDYVKKKFAFLANSPRGPPPLPELFMENVVHILLKLANSDTENGIKNKSKMKREKNIYNGYWKLDKTLFEEYQNNTAIEVEHRTEKKIYCF